MEPSLVDAPDLAEAVDRSLLGANLFGKAGQPSGCYTRTRVHCGEQPATLHHGRHALVAQGPLVSKPPCKLVNSSRLQRQSVALLRLPSLSREVHTGVKPRSAPAAQGCERGLTPRSCPLRCGRPVGGAILRSRTGGARPRMTRLVRLVRNSSLALAQAALGPGFTSALLPVKLKSCRPCRSSPQQRGV